MNLKARSFRVMPCVVCNYPFSDMHHAYPKRFGGKDTIALCPNHHRYANMIQTILMSHGGDTEQSARNFAKENFDSEFNDKALDLLIEGFYVTCPNYVDPLSEPEQGRPARRKAKR